MSLKKTVFIISLLSLSGISFAQDMQHSSVTLMNAGKQELHATYEILGARTESGEVTLQPKQSRQIALHASQKSVHVTTINGYATSAGGAKAQKACTSVANGNPIKLIFDSSAKQISISCQSNEA